MQVRVPLVIGLALALGGCPGSASMFELPSIPGVTAGRVDERDRVTQVLDDIHRGIEQRRVFKVLAHLSRTYFDEEGRDYDTLRNLITTWLNDYREIRVTRPRPRVVVQGDRARAIETFGLQAKPVNPNDDRLVALQGQVTVHLDKMGNTWQIVSMSSMQ